MGVWWRFTGLSLFRSHGRAVFLHPREWPKKYWNCAKRMRGNEMSLYNMALGTNPNAGLCLLILGLRVPDVPRFRDAWFNDDGMTIVILTRTGGGNREEYSIQNSALRQLPGFISDSDDRDDSTFAKFTFEVPDEFKQHTPAITTLLKAMGLGTDAWGPGGMIKRLEGHQEVANPKMDSPEFQNCKRALDAIKELIKQKQGS